MARRRRGSQQRQWLRNLKKLVQKILQWLGIGRYRRQPPDILPTPRSTSPAQQEATQRAVDNVDRESIVVGSIPTPPAQLRATQQTIGNVDRGSAVVGSITSVQGDVYVGVRPSTGIPFQVPPLPTHYVDRTETRERLKRNLLKEGIAQDRTLVVSAVYGLGGIGKSVLATALALDGEVQERFSDGVLWATLGQQPDILSFLGNWIQALRDFDYKPTTIEAASTYLRSLLYNKRMLLVVDDAWRSEDVEWFRIGGSGCRVLVTTREAYIPGAKRVDLEQMEPYEATLLLEGYLRKTLTMDERELALQFADAVGYLPLALELAAVQILDGASWKQLLVAFEEEVTRLEVLDAPDLDEVTTEKARKQRSLRASFNLSLRRLKQELLHRFAEMGVLPEDVNVGAEAMVTIWDVSLETAQKSLRELRRRSLLLDGVTWKEEPTYRMHDLMHDTARLLLKDLSKVTLAEAHCQVVTRYRALLSSESHWWTLPRDGYIHANLTWHMEQAGLADEIHALLQASNGRGQNAWFEACNYLGQPSIYVQDVARGWRLAEALYAQDRERAIVLQVRYALIVTTLNSLASTLPAPLLATLVRCKLWNLDQAWAYVSRDQSHKNLTFTLIELAPLLSKSYWKQAILMRHLYFFLYFLERSINFFPSELLDDLLEIVSQLEIDDKYSALIWISSIFPNAVPSGEILQLLKKSRNKLKDIKFLISQSNQKLLESLLDYLFASVIEESDPLERAEIISEIANRFSQYLPEAIQSIRHVEDRYQRARLFLTLCKRCRDKELLLDTFNEIIEISNRFQRIKLLVSYSQNIPSNNQEIKKIIFNQVKSLKNTDNYMPNLIRLSESFPELIPEIIEEARNIQNESTRSTIITRFNSNINEENINDFLDLAYSINMKSARNRALSHLSNYCNSHQIVPILDNVFKIEDIREVLTASLKISHPDSYLRIYSLIEPLDSNEDYAEVISLFLNQVKTIPESILKAIIDRLKIIEGDRDKLNILRRLASHLSEDILPSIEFLAETFSTYANRSDFWLILFEKKRDSQYIRNAIEEIEKIESPIQKSTSMAQAIPFFDEISTLEILHNLNSRDIDIPKKLIFFHAASFRSKKIIYLIEKMLPKLQLSLSDLTMIYVELYRTTSSNKYLKKVLIEINKSKNCLEKVRAMLHILPVKPIVYQTLEVINLLELENERLSAIAEFFDAYPYLNSEVYHVMSELHLLDDLIKSSNISSLIRLISYNSKLMNELIVIYGRTGSEETKKQFLGDIAPYLLHQSSLFIWLATVSKLSRNIDRAYVCEKLLEGQNNDLTRSQPMGYASWRQILHFLAHSERKVFLRNLPNLILFIQNFGGENTIQEAIRVVEEVCEQWK